MRVFFLIGFWCLSLLVVGQDIVPYKQDFDSLWENEADSINASKNKLWTMRGKVYLNINQGAQFNWAKGGENIFSSLTKTELTAKYKKGKQIWDNRLNWNYGFVFIGVPEDVKKFIDYRTSDDNIELNSSFGYQAGGDFYYNGLLNFKTQFLPSYKYPSEAIVSNFLSPAYVIFSIGINYKPSEVLKVMLSPITSKTTLVAKSEVDETKFGLEEGERLYREIGAYLTFYNKVKLYKDIDVENRLSLFSNYDNNPENIDVELKSDFSFKINKYVKATISFHFIYDDDASIPIESYEEGILQKTTYTKGLQFQEKIMIGIGYEF